MKRGILVYALVAMAGAGIGSFAVSWLLWERTSVVARQEIILPRSQLNSILPHQPLPEEQGAIVDAKPGHPSGHILASAPQNLPNGKYRLEMDVVMVEKQHSAQASCVMDLLCGDQLVSTAPVSMSNPTPQITFRAPGLNGRSDFIARLYCNGRAATRVLGVKFVRNPENMPAVVYQK